MPFTFVPTPAVHRAPTPTGSAGNGTLSIPNWDDMFSTVPASEGSRPAGALTSLRIISPRSLTVNVPVRPSNCASACFAAACPPPDPSRRKSFIV